MKKIMMVVALAGVLLAGCAKQEAAAPQEPAIPEARKFLVEGMVFLKQGDVKSAVASFASSIKAQPNDFEGYFMLSETFIQLKQYPQAVAVLNTAVRQFPDNGLAYYLLAVAYEGAEQTVPAIVAARRSVEIFNANKDEEGMKRSAVLLAALIQSAKQRTEEAAAAEAASASAAAAVVKPVAAPAAKAK